MKNAAKHLTDPTTKAGAIAFLRELIAHIESGVVSAPDFATKVPQFEV